MNSRLKLYDTYIQTYLEPKDKAKLKRIAFKNKMTISEFNRCLIQLVIKLDEMKKLNNKQEITDFDIANLISEVGRNVL